MSPSPSSRLLRNPAYRSLFTAQVVALLGTGLLTVALGLLAYDLAGSSAGAVLGTALTIKMVAYVVISPLAAGVTSRFSPRAVMVSADLVRAGIGLLLPFVDSVSQAYVLILLLQAASATFTPTFQALLPTVLKDERDYTRALSFSRLAYDLESLASPAIAALLLTVISFHGLFFGTVTGFLASAALVIRLRLPRISSPDSRGSYWHRVSAGSVKFVRNRRLRAVLALDLSVASATALVLVNTVVIVRTELDLSSTHVAIALAAYGSGSMLVALAIPRFLERVTDAAVMLPAGALTGLVIAGAAALLFVLPSHAWTILLVLWFLLGMLGAAVATPVSRLLNREASDRDRLELFAAQFSLSHACYLITYPLAGWIGQEWGQQWACVALAIIALSAAGGAVSGWPTRADPVTAEAD